MASSDAPARRRAPPPDDQTRARRRRFTAAGSLVAVSVVLAAIVLTSTGGSGSHAPKLVNHSSKPSASGRLPVPGAGTPDAAAVPILAYHVINAAPPSTTAPSALYVTADEFSAQMGALKANGWHSVTLDQLQAHWARGVPLGPGKPIVITFDNGYASQYTNALPVLKQLGWVGVENLRVNGLSPAEGGLTDSQIRSLISAGWELDTDGLSQADLTGLSSSQLSAEVATARRTLASRYAVNVNWFSYPSGNYDPTVIAAVRAAGFIGSTTTNPGWASPQQDRFRLPRLQVLAGTSPATLISKIAAAQQAPPSPDTAHNPTTA